jgi:hypothetical protein
LVPRASSLHPLVRYPWSHNDVPKEGRQKADAIHEEDDDDEELNTHYPIIYVTHFMRL